MFFKVSSAARNRVTFMMINVCKEEDILVKREKADAETEGI